VSTARTSARVQNLSRTTEGQLRETFRPLSQCPRRIASPVAAGTNLGCWKKRIGSHISTPKTKRGFQCRSSASHTSMPSGCFSRPRPIVDHRPQILHLDQIASRAPSEKRASSLGGFKVKETCWVGWSPLSIAHNHISVKPKGLRPFSQAVGSCRPQRHRCARNAIKPTNYDSLSGKSTAHHVHHPVESVCGSALSRSSTERVIPSS